MRSLGGRVGGGSWPARATAVGSSESEGEEADEEERDGEREDCLGGRGLPGANFRRVGPLRPEVLGFFWVVIDDVGRGGLKAEGFR